MKPFIAFIAGLSVFPLIALALWVLTRRERVGILVPDIDPETLARTRAAQAAAEDYMYQFSLS